MTSTGQDSTTTRQRRRLSVTSKQNIKKGAVPCSIPNLAEVKKKSKVKKVGQAIEEDLITGLQGMDLNLEAEALAGTGLVLDEQLNEFHCLWDDSFPEGPEWLHAIRRASYTWFAEKEELLLVHSLEYIDLMETTQYMNDGELPDPVHLHPKSYSCACLVSGSVLRLVDVVLGAEIWNGMAIIRPPGHHAQHSLTDAVACSTTWLWQLAMLNRNTASGGSLLWIGMCITVKEHSSPLTRTQVSSVSPSTAMSRVGIRDADYIAAFLHILLPVALEFQPQLVLVAAGFDALQGDPKGEMAASPAGFTQLTHLLMGLSGGKLSLSLEGGCNLCALAEGISASLHTLLGDPCPMLESPGTPCQKGDNVEEDNVEERDEEGPWEPPVLPILTWPVLQSRTGLV
ncbi:Histone deacetylase 6 [Plecturocebus cupreus]